MKINYGHGEKDIEISPWTLVVYETEFNGNMIADVFDKVELTDGDISNDGAIVIDYTKTQWTSIIKALWASLKAADDDFLPFKEWAKGVGDVDMYEVVSVIVPEMQRKLFHPGASDSE